MDELMNLSEGHLTMLRDGSAISDAVIQARGYRTVTDPKELADLGFAPRQRRVPALLLPLHTTDGGIGPCMLRPDDPRIVQDKDGKTRRLKYEAPKDSGTRLDCPPTCLAALGDPAIPLWVTEGQKKADALASLGLCALALLGVWNWRGKNAAGGITFLADWDNVALNNGREVRLVFDSDVMVKAGVRLALDRLMMHLQRRGAHVVAVYLPNAPDGGKLGVDNYLAQGHTLLELEALVEAPHPAPRAAASQVELLDSLPDAMRRPLRLLDGHAYAAAWLPCRVTRTEKLSASGVVMTLIPPEVVNEIRLFVVRDDGLVFGEGADQAPAELGFEVLLSEVPRADKTLTTKAVKAYRAGARPNPLEVFGRVCDVLERFMDFNSSLADQATMCAMVACYILATWFLDAFNAMGFIWSNGDKGAGKTNLIILIAEMAYLGEFILSAGTMATLRDLADYGALLAFDDAENVNDPKRFDPDKRALLLAGNRRGATVPLKEPVGARGWRTRYVDAFCPRCFSAIRMPDNVLGSRSIVVPLVRTNNRAKANADPKDYVLWPHDRRKLVDDLWALALAHLGEMKEYDAKIADRAAVVGRALQPWRALLAIGLWLDSKDTTGVLKWKNDKDVNQGLFDRLDALSVAYQTERPELELSDLTVLVLKALQAICDGSDGSDGSDGKDIDRSYKKNLFSDEIRVRVDGIAEEDDVDISWMGEPAKRTLRIGRILGQLRFEAKRTGKKRGWLIDGKHLGKLLFSYNILIPIPSQPALPSQPSQTGEPEGEAAARGGGARDLDESDNSDKPDHPCRVGANHRTWWRRKGEREWKCNLCHPATSPHIETWTVPPEAGG